MLALGYKSQNSESEGDFVTLILTQSDPLGFKDPSRYSGCATCSSRERAVNIAEAYELKDSLPCWVCDQCAAEIESDRDKLGHWGRKEPDRKVLTLDW